MRYNLNFARYVFISCLVLLHNVSSFTVPTSESVQVLTVVAESIRHTTVASDIVNTYKDMLGQFPLPTKMLTGGTLSTVGDAIAQSKDRNSPYDTRRALSFAAFDMAYRALQHASFPYIIQQCHGQFICSITSAISLPLLLDQHSAAAMEQTLASQLIIVPFLYYPAFYTLTATIQGLDFDGAVQRAQETFLPLMQRNLLFWIPVQFIQFGYIEESLQIPFLSVCGLAWTFILSMFAGSAKQYSTNQSMIPSSVKILSSPVSASETIADTLTLDRQKRSLV
jgi:Mpv17 / PMP22 family